MGGSSAIASEVQLARPRRCLLPSGDPRIVAPHWRIFRTRVAGPHEGAGEGGFNQGWGTHTMVRLEYMGKGIPSQRRGHRAVRSFAIPFVLTVAKARSFHNTLRSTKSMTPAAGGGFSKFVFWNFTPNGCSKAGRGSREGLQWTHAMHKHPKQPWISIHDKPKNSFCPSLTR